MRNPTLTATLVALVALALVAPGCGNDGDAPSYAGVWTLSDVVADGQKQTIEPATLTLTASTFRTESPTSLCNSQSGSVSVAGDQMTWVVETLNGPHACGAVGTITVFTFSVTADTLSLASTQNGIPLQETYTR